MLRRDKVVAGVALCRRLCCKPSVNYTAVNHGLDEEEIAFKNSLEAQHDDGVGRGGDDIDELFNFSGQEELEFDTNDLDNLEMLQVCFAFYRKTDHTCVHRFCEGHISNTSVLAHIKRQNVENFHVGSKDLIANVLPVKTL